MPRPLENAGLLWVQCCAGIAPERGVPQTEAAPVRQNPAFRRRAASEEAQNVPLGSNSANHPDFQLVRFVSDSGPLLQRQVRRIMPVAVVHNFLP